MQLTSFDDPVIDPDELAAANRRCEDELRRMGIDPRMPSGIRSPWRPESLVRRGMLTDKKLAAYLKAGWFSEEFRQARKDLVAKRSGKVPKRVGSFFERGGRLIYSP